MSGPQFFETRMGQQFYDGTMKRLADAAVDIAGSLKLIAAYTTMKVEQAKDAQDAPQNAAFLDHLQNTLSGKEWDADTLAAVAQILRDSGRPIAEPDQSCPTCGAQQDCREDCPDRDRRTWKPGDPAEETKR